MRRLRHPLGWGLLPLAAACLLAVGCGQHRPTIWLSSSAAGATSASSPAPPLSGGALSGTGPVSSAAPVATGSSPARPPAALELKALGPGPRALARDAREATVLALELVASADLSLSGLRLRAEGSLDDAQAVQTARLALDLDGDGRFDRNVDRVLSSGGFLQDDGELEFWAALPLPAGQPIRLVVTLDLNGAARPGDTCRLRLASDACLGGPPVLALAGPLHRIERWVTPHEPFPTAGDGLAPRAVRDSQGRTHVSLFQNYNFNSDVWYTLWDGQRYSPVYDVSHSPRTSWNQDLALDANDSPLLVWEASDPALADYAVRFSRFDGSNFAWTPAEAVSSEAGLFPRVACVGGRIHVVWEGRSGGVFHRARDGQGWGAIAELSSATPQTRTTRPSLCALPSGELLALWAENDPTRSEIRARTLDQGAGYGPLELVASAPQQIERPVALAEAGRVHAAYEWGGEVYYTQRGPQGWLAGINLSQSAALSGQAALALHRGRLQVVWIEDETGTGLTATQVAHVEDTGAGFSAPALLTRGIGSRLGPSVLSEGDRLTIFWQDFGRGRPRIFTTWREDEPWSAIGEVARPGAEPGRAALARTRLGGLAAAYPLDGGEVWVARADGPDGAFGRPANVSRSASGSYAPSLAAVGSAGLVAVWEEDLPQGFAIRAALGDEQGWSTPATISSAGPAYTPCLIAQGPDEVEAVWCAPGASGRFELQSARWLGGAWGTVATLASDARADLRAPHLAHEDQTTVTVFEREESGRREVWCLTRAPGGASLAAVASSASGQYAPRVALVAGEVLVGWIEDGRVRVASRPAGASSFDPPQDLTASGAWSLELAVSGGEVWACWEQWSGAEVRPLAGRRGPSGWGAPRALDRAGVSARRVSALGTPTGGLEVTWSEPSGLVVRQRGETP